ncbi:MAG: hypothetical protein RR561_07795 [Peptostreptococcus sp.]|uniref:hypothetical protein n=1 Tax=Peptostreptococcus sp. TaxID=1262 RepID=UPI002FC7C927
MKTRRLSPLGFLMESLNIQSVLLSRELHVDASLISKWKSGVRKISSSSIYFDQIVEFILEESKKSNHQILSKLLSEIYPLEDIKDDRVKDLLIMLLASKEVVYTDQLDIQIDNQQSLVNIASYEQNNGRRKAIMTLLDYAKTMKSAGKIIFIDSEEYDWLLEDIKFAEKFKEEFLALLDRGFEAEFVIHFSSYRKRFIKFFESFNELLFHQNVKWYYYECYDEDVFKFSQFILDKSISLLGISASHESSTTMVFTDTSSIIKHWTMAKTVIANCHELFVNFETEKCDEVLEYVAAIRKRGAIYSYLPVPAFVSTSSNLLEEILRDNNIEERKIDQCLSINKKMRDMIKFQYHGLENVAERVVQIFQLEEMKRRIDNAEFISCSLTLLGDQLVKVSKKQYAQGLKELAHNLEINNNMSVVLLSSVDNVSLPAISEMNCWCKQNTWMIQMDGKGFRISDEVSIVNAASIAFERCIRKVPPERKEKSSVISYLFELSKTLETVE